MWGILGGVMRAWEGSSRMQIVKCGIRALPQWRGVQGPREDCGRGHCWCRGPSAGDAGRSGMPGRGNGQRPGKGSRRSMTCAPGEAGSGETVRCCSGCSHQDEVRDEPGWQGGLSDPRQDPHVRRHLRLPLPEELAFPSEPRSQPRALRWWKVRPSQPWGNPGARHSTHTHE